jgi:hypothetical protein
MIVKEVKTRNKYERDSLFFIQSCASFSLISGLSHYMAYQKQKSA